MKIALANASPVGPINIADVCPHCGHRGTFESINGNFDIANSHPPAPGVANWLGVRRCPNKKCNGHLFFIANGIREIMATFPGRTIPFDKENIPEKVLNAFEEAVKCHGNNCFIASAIMIRKTLELICADKNAAGVNLFQKLQSLGNIILIPAALIAAMTELRLLGNDAAHVDAKEFDEIGKEEIEISIEFTKEILKAVYQYDGLLAKMQALKTKNSIASTAPTQIQPS